MSSRAGAGRKLRLRTDRHYTLPVRITLRFAEAYLRTDAENSHKMGKPDRRVRGDNANVCTSRARAQGFFAHKARTNSSKLARSADGSSRPYCRSLDGKQLDNALLTAARNALE